MKKITTYILSLLLVLLGSCVNDRLGGDADGDKDGKVTLKFGLVIPETVSVAARGLLDEADGENTPGYLSKFVPYIFIFEDTGQPETNYLRTLVHGDQITPGTDAPDDSHAGNYVMNFSATVDGTAEDAIIHIVLIHPDEKVFFEEQLTEITDRSELGIFSGTTGLYTYKASYWKRILLGMPINTDNKPRIKPLLSHVNLVRNFAQVTMAKDEEAVPDSRFTIDGFVIVNAMDCGYVAAYNENTAATAENFVEFEDGNGMPASYTYITKDVEYIPNRHPYAERLNKDNELAWADELTEADWTKEKKYMFERPVQDSHRTFVLLRGRFNGAATSTYYKIDIGDYDKREYDATYNPYGVFEVYNLMRNMSYDITIKGVASAGHESIASAVAGPPANNITASVETRNILRIGNGEDIIGINAFRTDNNMLIDGTTVVIVDYDNGDPNPAGVNLRWQYYLGETGKYENDRVMHDYPGYDLKTTASGGTIITSKSDWANAGTDWKGYTLTFDRPTDTPKSETVRFYKSYGMSRDVTFILRKRWAFINDNDPNYPSNVEVYPGLYSFDDKTMPCETLSELRKYLDAIDGVEGPGEVGSQRGAQLTVMFELPSDIPQSLFPLEFKIGFDRQNVENAYAGNANVVYGDSMFDDDGSLGVPRMQFVKTVTWDYYNGSGDISDQGHKIVCARFLTTTDVISNNETDNDNGETSTTRVRVTNPYFTLGEDSFLRQVTNNENPDPDANRTVWSWYFGDPGWTKYFDETDASHNAAGSYNELWYNRHVWATWYGQYIGIPHSYNSSDTNPDFQFWPNATATVSGNAKLTITGGSLYFRERSGGGDYYRRRAFVKIEITRANGTNDVVSFTDNEFYFDNRDGSNHGKPQEKSVTFNLAEGDVVNKVTIWSGRYSNDSTNDTYARTLYYALRFTMP